MDDAAAQSFLMAHPQTVPSGVGVVPVDPVLAGLFPDRGLRRGSVLGVSGASGSVSLLMALMSKALSEGLWVGVVGIPDLGVEAAAGLGARLDHLALVPDPGTRWTEVAAALLDSLDVVVLSLPRRCAPSDARRLAARTRERHAALVVVELPPVGAALVSSGGVPAARRWGEPLDLQLEVASSAWHGLDAGYGALRSRELTIRSFGRRAAARERLAHVWLPTAEGGLAAAEGGSGLAAAEGGLAAAEGGLAAAEGGSGLAGSGLGGEPGSGLVRAIEALAG